MKFRRRLISVLLLVAISTCLSIFSSLEAGELQSGGLDANGAAAILGETVDNDRYLALNALEPKIKLGLTGEEFSKVLGNSSSSNYRSMMIVKVAHHARDGLEADEVVVILGETVDNDRNLALNALEPKIKRGLSGEGFSKVLGNSSGLNYRSMMIKILSDHAGDQLAAVAGQNKAVASTEKSFFSSILKELPMQLIQAACDGFLLNVCSYFELPVRVGGAVEEWKPVLNDLANPDEPPQTGGGKWFRAIKCNSLKGEEEYWKCLGI